MVITWQPVGLCAQREFGKRVEQLRTDAWQWFSYEISDALMQEIERLDEAIMGPAIDTVRTLLELGSEGVSVLQQVEDEVLGGQQYGAEEWLWCRRKAEKIRSALQTAGPLTAAIAEHMLASHEHEEGSDAEIDIDAWHQNYLEQIRESFGGCYDAGVGDEALSQMDGVCSVEAVQGPDLRAEVAGLVARGPLSREEAVLFVQQDLMSAYNARKHNGIFWDHHDELQGPRIMTRELLAEGVHRPCFELTVRL